MAFILDVAFTSISRKYHDWVTYFVHVAFPSEAYKNLLSTSYLVAFCTSIVAGWLKLIDAIN